MADPITVTDLENATLDVTTIAEVAMVGTTEDTVQNRDGDTLDTLQGRLNKVGFEPPIAYTSGITFTDSQDSAKTIEESLVIYGCMPSARPFTTTGDFLADSANFFVVQIAGTVSGNVRTDTDNTYDPGTTQNFADANLDGNNLKELAGNRISSSHRGDLSSDHVMYDFSGYSTGDWVEVDITIQSFEVAASSGDLTISCQGNASGDGVISVCTSSAYNTDVDRTKISLFRTTAVGGLASTIITDIKYSSGEYTVATAKAYIQKYYNDQEITLNFGGGDGTSNITYTLNTKLTQATSIPT